MIRKIKIGDGPTAPRPSVLIVPSYKQCDSDAERLVAIEKRVAELLPAWRVVLFDRVVGDGYFRVAPHAPTKNERWAKTREMLADEFEALVVVENELGALGAGQTSFVETFKSAGRRIKVARGEGAALRFEEVADVSRTGIDDYKEEFGRVETAEDVKQREARRHDIASWNDDDLPF